MLTREKSAEIVFKPVVGFSSENQFWIMTKNRYARIPTERFSKEEVFDYIRTVIEFRLIHER